MHLKAAILTTGHNGQKEQEDTSAQVIRELVEEELTGFVIDYRIVPDEIDEIMAALIEMSEYHEAELILTVGGIGLAPSDRTPEATRRVIDREVPGLAEAIRAHCMKSSPNAIWQRGIAGIRGRTLIVNLPESPKGVVESMQVLIEHLPYGIAILKAIRGNTE